MKESRALQLTGTIAMAFLMPLLLLSVSEAQPTSGQNEPTDEQGATTQSLGQLSEVVVTAEKRTENVLEVPVSIGVLSGEQLQQQHITGLEDLARSVPDLADTLPGNGVMGQGNFSIRGVSSSGSLTGGSLGQATIGVYLDDVAMSAATGGNVGDTGAEIFDVNRIEVLRGPQGTLYGASSMGGAIRYISNQPDLTKASWSLLGTLSATHSGGINYVEQAVGNVPLITNSLGLRVGAQVTSNGGYIPNYDPYTGVTTPDANDNKSAAIRASLKWQSSDNSLTVLPSVFMQRFNNDGDSTAWPDTHYLAEYYEPLIAADKTFIPSVTVNKDFGFAALSAVTSYFSRQWNGVSEGTYGLELPIFGVPYPTPFPGGSHTTQGAEELRLTSKTQQQSGLPFDWIVGAYYADNNTTRWVYLVPQNLTAFTNTLINAYGTAGYDAFGVAQYGSDLYTQWATLRTAQVSEFGEFNYSPVKQLTATVGLRYLNANQLAYNISTGFLNGPVPFVYTQPATASHASPKFALKYSYSANGQVYATAVEGFRLGGANQPIPTDPTTGIGAACLANLQAIGRNSNPLTYSPDSLWSYELGDKSALWGNRVTLEASVFDIIWKGVQQDIALPCTYDFIVNAGQAKSQGGDLNFDARVTAQLEVHASGNITHAFISTPAAGTGEVVGSWLEGVPRWQASAGFAYSPTLGGLSTFATMDGHWVGQAHQFFDPTQSGYAIPQYFLLNATFGVNLSNSWQISVFATNILDDDTFILTTNAPPFQGDTLQPRTIGVTVQKNL